MAYFRENETEETTKKTDCFSDGEKEEDSLEFEENDYDDGFEELTEETNLSDEERKEIRTKRFRAFSGAGNITAVITGTVVILILLALLMNMIGFVLNDADRNFTLLQTRF